MVRVRMEMLFIALDECMQIVQNLEFCDFNVKIIVFCALSTFLLLWEPLASVQQLLVSAPQPLDNLARVGRRQAITAKRAARIGERYRVIGKRSPITG